MSNSPKIYTKKVVARKNNTSKEPIYKKIKEYFNKKQNVKNSFHTEVELSSPARNNRPHLKMKPIKIIKNKHEDTGSYELKNIENEPSPKNNIEKGNFTINLDANIKKLRKY